MRSLIHLTCIIGLAFISFVICTQEEALAMPTSEEQFELEKRRIDSSARTSIPLFRGSNLGIFVRKRPFNAPVERSAIPRKDSYQILPEDEHILMKMANTREQYQRRFDGY